MTVGSGFELVNASTVTSQQSPVSSLRSKESQKSKVKRHQTVQRFNNSTVQQLTVDDSTFQRFNSFKYSILEIIVYLQQVIIISNMETINVRINVTTPTGKRLLREMEKHPKIAKVDYPLPEGVSEQKTYTIEESYDECCKILSDHYKVDVRKL